MIRVSCNVYAGVGDHWEILSHYELVKPQWEHMVNTLYKQGGHAGKNICPVCGQKSLEFDFDFKYLEY